MNRFEKIKCIVQNRKNIVFGYLRECQYLLPTNQAYYQVHEIIQLNILLFYGNHPQIVILKDDHLRQLSVELVTPNNNEFVNFLKKIFKSKLNAKIWNRCDPNNTGKIETEKF
eukprot:434442_1